MWSFSQPIGYYIVCTRYGTFKEVEHVNLQNEVSYIYFKSRPSISRIIKFSIVFYSPPCLLFSIQFLYEIGIIILIHRFIWPIAPHKKHRIIWWDILDYTHFLVLCSSYILMWSKIYFFAWICITTFYGTISIIVKYAFTQRKKKLFLITLLHILY